MNDSVEEAKKYIKVFRNTYVSEGTGYGVIIDLLEEIERLENFKEKWNIEVINQCEELITENKLMFNSIDNYIRAGTSSKWGDGIKAREELIKVWQMKNDA